MPFARTPLRRVTRVIPHLAVAAAIAFAMPFTLAPSPVSAGSCTGHSSRMRPPDTIRVFRTATGAVDVVPFRDYVGIVMASGEWPYYLPVEALKVGATAVKQFAWYYALEGHHRSWYVNGAGQCYDVKDNTDDQLFKPERAEVKVRQLTAIEATWGLTLRKNGRFFLTGYRYGDDVPCGADRNGWKIFERSVVDCAEKGWDRQRIQEHYLSPNIEFVWSEAPAGEPGDDGTYDGPAIRKPAVGIRSGGKLGGRTLDVSWGTVDDAAGVTAWSLQRSVDGGSWQTVSLGDAQATSARITANGGHSYRFRVRGQEEDGSWSTWSLSRTTRLRILESQEASLRGGWTKVSDDSASGNVLRMTDATDARATLTFTGRGIGIVAPRAPGRGSIRVFVDGTEVALVDLEAASKQPRRLVWARDWGGSAEHTIRVVAVGDGRVDLDAFLVTS